MDVEIEVELTGKTKQLLDASGLEPGELINCALNRMIAQLPLGKDRRTQDRRVRLRLVETIL